MQTIRSLKPNVTREEAIASLSPGGFVGVLHNLSRGPLRSIADVYVPFRLYHVQVDWGGRSQHRWLALDAVRGSLDLYGFDRALDSAQLIQLQTRNRPEPALDEEASRAILAEKVRRLIFREGFFRIRNLRIRAEHVPMDLHIPYWVGFFGCAERAHLSVMDAVRRRFEGARARQLFEDWLGR